MQEAKLLCHDVNIFDALKNKNPEQL